MNSLKKNLDRFFFTPKTNFSYHAKTGRVQNRMHSSTISCGHNTTARGRRWSRTGWTQQYVVLIITINNNKNNVSYNGRDVGQVRARRGECIDTVRFVRQFFFHFVLFFFFYSFFPGIRRYYIIIMIIIIPLYQMRHIGTCASQNPIEPVYSNIMRYAS